MSGRATINVRFVIYSLFDQGIRYENNFSALILRTQCVVADSFMLFANGPTCTTALAHYINYQLKYLDHLKLSQLSAMSQTKKLNFSCIKLKQFREHQQKYIDLFFSRQQLSYYKTQKTTRNQTYLIFGFEHFKIQGKSFSIYTQLYTLMRKIILLTLSLLIHAHSFQITIKEPLYAKQNENLTQGTIIPGRGYSRDKQQMSQIQCFNTKQSPYSKTESIVRFDQGSTFNELQTTFKYDVQTKVNIGIFSVQVDLQYMKLIRDTDYTLTINYYQMVQSELTMEMGYGPAGALTLEGLRAYGQISNPNPRFGLICGDKFISSFKLGASLLFSIKLHFHTHTQKETFSAKLGVKFGPFNIISKQIQKIAESTNSSGQVKILAHQSGGNPAELSQLLNASCGGEGYCAASCTMVKMTDCQSAINGLLKYAIENFPNQVKVHDPTTMTSFSQGFANMQDIKWIGLDAPASFVTKEVISMRERLANTKLKYEYYYESLTNLMQGSLPWVKTSNLYTKIDNCWKGSKINMDMLMNQQSGGITCFNDPERCQANGESIISHLNQECSAENINSIVGSIKYKLSTDLCSAIFYRIGDNNWTATNIDSRCATLNVKSFNVLPTSMSYYIEIIYRGDPTLHTYIGDNLKSANQDGSFTGTRHHKWSNQDIVENTSVGRVLSEYYFSS